MTVNEPEAEQVREIYNIYLDKKSLLATLAEVDQRGWSTKVWTTKKGIERGGQPFDKSRLHKVLTNKTYLGKMSYQDEIHEGLHDAIVDPEIFAQVQQQLEQNRIVQGIPNRKRTPALLKGLLYCDPCGTAMVATYTQKGKKRYRYYVCHTAQKRSWQYCPSKSIPAAEIETYVVDQIREIGQSPKLIKATIKAVRKKQNEIAQKFASEQTQLKQSLTTANRELTRQLQSPQGPDIDRLAELQNQIQKAEVALRTNLNEQARHQRLEIPDEQIIESLSQFDRLWSSMSLKEQSRCLNLLIERVGYNGEDGTVAITLRPTGLEEFLQQTTTEEIGV